MLPMLRLALCICKAVQCCRAHSGSVGDGLSKTACCHKVPLDLVYGWSGRIWSTCMKQKLLVKAGCNATMPLGSTTAKDITAGVMELHCHHLPSCCDSVLMPAVAQAAGTESDLMLQDGRANHTCACQLCISPEVDSMICLPMKGHPLLGAAGTLLDPRCPASEAQTCSALP